MGAAEGWCPDYVRAAYRRWFLDHEEAGSERSNSDCLHAIGQDARQVLERAASEATTKAYEAATAEARSLGIFGVPTFVSRGEIIGATTGWTMPSVGTKSGIEPERNCTVTARDVLEKFGAGAPQIGGAS